MSFKTQIILGLILILSVSGGLIFLRFNNPPPPPLPPIPSPTETVSSYPSNPVINFPEAESATPSKIFMGNFDYKTMRLEFRQVVHPDALEKSVWDVVYYGLDKKTTRGYEISYKLDNTHNLSQVYQDQIDSARFNGWKILAADLQEKTAFIDLERKTVNTTYKIRLSLEDKGSFLTAKAQFLLNF